ncbi:MAG: metallophosphoesterase family protein [Pseudomonadales bacterium]
MKNIAHISDLHLSCEMGKGFYSEDCCLLLEHLLNDFYKLKNENGIEVDSVFFTGDLTFSGTSEEYECVLEKFIKPLMKRLELSKNNIYIVPGNHDCNRKNISRIEKGFRDNYSEKDISDTFEDLDSGVELWDRMSSFLEFKNKLLLGSKNVLSKNVMFSAHKISNKLYVICANSAWLAQDDNDKSKLRISKSQIDRLLYKIPKDSHKILLMHHPY